MADDKQPNIAYVRPEVEARLSQWAMIDDVLAGEAAIKGHDLATVTGGAPSLTTSLWYRYLPMPNAAVQTAENQERYRQYIERAVFAPITARTHAGLVGQAFLRPPVLELPPELEYLADDVDGAGVGLLSQARKALGYVLGPGRCGLLTDYPAAEKIKKAAGVTEGGALTQAQVEALNIRPTIGLYGPESIINWRTTVVGARRVLTLVVLAETYEASDDGFESTTAEQWRVLSLDEAGGYVVDLLRAATVDKQTVYQSAPGYPTEPTNRNGQRLAYIPFQFIGSVNNDVEIDPAPMYDHASLNLGHYRCAADYFENAYVHGQTTIAAIGITKQWWEETLHGSMNLGARGGIPLEKGSDAKTLQAGANTIAFEAMKHVEEQLRLIGAKLIETRPVAITATEARQNHAAEISVLGTCAVNVASAYTTSAGKWAGDFVGATKAGKMEIDPEFELGSLTAQELAQVVACWKDKAIATVEMRKKLRAAGIATLSDDDFKVEMAKEKPEPAPEPVVPPVVPGDKQDPLVGDEGQPEGGA